MTFHIGMVTICTNTGTYLDVPFHRFADGHDLTGLELGRVAAVPAVYGSWMSARPSEPTVKGPPEGDEAAPQPIWHELAGIPESMLSGPGLVLAAAMAPQGSARPVLVLPGFTSGDLGTIPLRAFLRALGHRPSGWGLGMNVGVADHIVVGLDRVLRELAHRHGTTIDIVGWSAGGLLARLLAQNRSEYVGQVISLGSPVRLRVDDHNLGALPALVGKLFVPFAPHISTDSVPVPSTTIWTADDGVVSGTHCKQPIGPDAEAIQVRGTHVGLGSNPAVMYAIADRLAQTGPWKPFDPPRRLRWMYGELDSDETS